MDFPVEAHGSTPECYVAVKDTRQWVGEFPSYGSALAYIYDQQDSDERLGLVPLEYEVIPVKASPGGRDIR